MTNQRNPHGDQRRLTPTQRVLARNTRAGIATVDRINAGNAVRIGDRIRDVGNRPLTEADHEEIMRYVDRILDETFGHSRATVLASPMGRAILNQCLQTGQGVDTVEQGKETDVRVRALRRDPAFARELLRRHGS